jgi:hypothetical protein
MKYVNQLDYPNMQYITLTANPDPERRAFGLKTTIAGSGCALCTAVMIADRLHVGDGNFGIEEARQLSYDCGANQKGGTMGIVYFPAFAEKFDLEMVRTSNIEEMRHCLRTGGAVGILVSGDHDDYHGVFSDRWMHWMVVVSEERDGRFCILDPAYEEGIYEKGDRKGKVEVISRGFSRTTAQVLQEETATVKDGGFCLFWRK